MKSLKYVVLAFMIIGIILISGCAASKKSQETTKKNLKKQAKKLVLWQKVQKGKISDVSIHVNIFMKAIQSLSLEAIWQRTGTWARL